LAQSLDDGCIPLTKTRDVKAFLEALAELRFWRRELNVDLDAKS
jgi:catalase